jgi:predicted nucleotidyltransferase
MNYLETYSPDIKKLCALHNVKSLYAFGSVLSDQMSYKSDVDFIVDFNTELIKNYADNYFDLKFSLEDIFKRPVDLIEEQAIKNPYFKQSLNNHRKLVYGY